MSDANIPEGFKQTEIGPIPEDWRLQKIGNLLKIRHGKAQHEVSDKNGNYPILASSGEIGRSRCFLYNKPSVLIGRKGTINRPQYMAKPFWSVDTLFYSEINSENHPKFFFYKISESNSDLISKLHLEENGILKRAAALLFYDDPEKFFTGAYIKIGYFADNSEILFFDEIHGHLFSQIDTSLDLIMTKYLKARVTYRKLQRVEILPVPVSALREALLNAIAHKDYSSGIPVQISVYEDKILFWNPGNLPPGWTVENLVKKHASQPFNPEIANVLFRAGYIEAWGRGIEKIFKVCREFKIPEPELIVEETGFWMVFKFADSSDLAETPVEIVENIENESKTPVEFEENTENESKTPVEKFKTQDLILTEMTRNPEITLAEIAKNINRSLRAVERAVAKLNKKGIIKHVGPTKKGQWKILHREKL